ncbi:hypothetical protein M3M33_17190, partial [Loigolactobacillus coryniformis]|uniref:hypothetical protein n=1 Tax=Loigolactobacillus coryniformis TaxID=1610 RepID=UPI00201AE5C0
MIFKVTERLLQRVRDILSSDPLELYEDGTTVDCNFKLVDSRYINSEDDDEENRHIGSANMLLAASLLGYI